MTRAPLSDSLARLGEQPLLVLSDYDGTLAPIALRPEDARPQEGAREALRSLLHHPRHAVAVVTGRSIEAAQTFLGVPDLPVVGLHGMEWPDQAPPQADRAALQDIARQLRPLINREGEFHRLHGLRLEDKRWTLALHYRNVALGEHGALEAHLEKVALPPNWEVVNGKLVREFRPAGFGKGRAARRLALNHPGKRPVFLGDDVTDEEAFLAVHDLGGVAVKVGEGPSVAHERVESPAEVVALLRLWARET